MKKFYLRFFKSVGWVNGSLKGYDFEAKVYKEKFTKESKD